MDGSQFDDLLRRLAQSRRTMLGTALAAAGGMSGLSSIDARKKKKKCAKKCKTGCCTGKYGKCILPPQQTATQCGTGGEICRSGCGGIGGGGGGTTTPQPTTPDPICDRDSCATCCFGGVCVASANAHFGFGGITCKPCGTNAKCTAEGDCCGFVGHDCTGGFKCCDDLKCHGNTCCAEINKPCQKNEDCCDPSNVICENSICVVRKNKSCQPQQTCQGQYLCPDSGLCDTPNGCSESCTDFDKCEAHTCEDRLYCCNPADIEFCIPEVLCGCIIEGGQCHQP